MKESPLAIRLKQRSQALNKENHNALTQTAIGSPDGVRLRTLTLSSGKKINLRLHTFNGVDEIEQKTRIDNSNIREQSWLNKQSLSDILPTIATIQLYPAIGYFDKDSILIVDGSRRRAAAIFSDCGYVVEVSDQPLTKSEAVEIIGISDKKKKFTDFEWGKFYTIKLKSSKLTQKAFSKQEGISEATISRYINAYNVDNRLYNLFLDKDSINSVADSQRLIKIFKSINSSESGIDIDDFVNDTNNLIENKLNQCYTPDYHKNLVFDCLEEILKTQQAAKVGRKKKKLEPIALFSGSKNNEFIRYKDDSPHKATIILSRIDIKKRDKIKELIQKIMDDDDI